jgi:hypothetical protein
LIVGLAVCEKPAALLMLVDRFGEAHAMVLVGTGGRRPRTRYGWRGFRTCWAKSSMFSSAVKASAPNIHYLVAVVPRA